MGATHFLDLAVAPKLPPEWGRFSGTALDRAGHYMLATICYQTFIGRIGHGWK
jgi:hypothetical protein